jgi:hypothetical protein
MMTSPFARPTASPTAMPPARAAGMDAPCRNRSAQTTPDIATTDPTERSMPPVRIANPIPAARIAVKAFWRRTFIRLSGLTKAELVQASRAPSARSATKIA